MDEEEIEGQEDSTVVGTQGVVGVGDTTVVCTHWIREHPRLTTPPHSTPSLFMLDLRGGGPHHALQPEERDGGGLL